MSLREWYWIYDVRRSDADKASLLADQELWELIGEDAPFA
jgi:hypothetical protein